MIILKRVKGFILHPRQAFENERKSSSGEALKYLLVMIVINSLLSGVAYASIGLNELAVMGILIMFFAGLVSTIAGFVWVYAWSFAFGGRDLGKTLKIVLYGSTPIYLVGWLTVIPDISLTLLKLVLLVWSFVLFGIGLKTISGMSTKRAWIVAGGSFLAGFALFYWFGLVVMTQVIPFIYSF